MMTGNSISPPCCCSPTWPVCSQCTSCLIRPKIPNTQCNPLNTKCTDLNPKSKPLNTPKYKNSQLGPFATSYHLLNIEILISLNSPEFGDEHIKDNHYVANTKIIQFDSCARCLPCQRVAENI